MQYRKAILLLSILLNAFHFHISAQELYFDIFGTSEGLPSSETYHALQDSKGYVWVTSDAGICRFSDSGIKVFNAKDGLTENVVFNIYEDPHGRIWFNSLSGSLFYFENGKLNGIGANEELKKICKAFPISSFFMGEKDSIFCSVPVMAGYMVIPPDNNFKELIIRRCHEKVNRFVLLNKRDPSEFIVGAGGAMVNPTDSTASALINGKKVTLDFRGMTVVASNAWIGEKDRRGNLFLLNGNIIHKISPDGEITRKLFSYRINSIDLDKDGDLWVSTAKGILLYKNAELSNEPRFMMPKVSAAGVLVDAENTVWVCSLGKGLLRARSKYLLNYPGVDRELVSFVKNGNKLDVAFSSSDVLRYSENSDKSEKLPLNFEKGGYLNFYFPFRDKIYYSSRDDMIMTDTKSGKDYNVRDGMVRLPVKKVLQWNEDTLIAYSFRSIVFIRNEKILKIFEPPVSINCMTKLRNGTVLIGSRSAGGLGVVDLKGYKSYRPDLAVLKTRVNSIKEDKAGRIWIGTNEHGLYCIDEKGKLYDFSPRISDKINAIDEDEEGVIWLATNQGLIKLINTNDLEKCSILHFNENHGLPTPEIRNMVVFDKKIWCGSKEIFFSFPIRQMRINTQPPFVHITNVQVNERDLTMEDLIMLEHNENNISLNFEGTSMKNIGKNGYLYKLEGYDNEFHFTANGNVQYTNLDPGDYKFIVYAKNNDGIKSLKPATISFHIDQAFWQWWWVVALEIIAVIAFVYLLVRNRVRNIKRKEAEKTFLNKRLSEFQLTAIRAQMNPHFIFNAISSIQHYILKNDTYSSYEYLSKFSKLIRKVLDHSQHESISLEEEITMLKLYIELEQLRFTEPFRAHISVGEGIATDEIFIPTMLLQPYVENAILHGLAGKKKDADLWIGFSRVGDELEIRVRDNGLGRKPNVERKNLHDPKGMSLTAEGLEALRVKNEKEFTVMIADLTDEKGQPTGTEVKIRIPLE